ncbi:uncharacterized protein LOC130809468 [Amaranthus tricolor]|uniref:uncharacterized protein LOC130809468 n=1 Tax=Amaranthus tricolor TaxID=29722 RepID=UPI0025834FAE|nr:uncharacterized protein LOC130809468 [Amaranthus tricolor]
MSCFSLPKKLKHLPSSSKKAWNSFTLSLSPKLHRLRRRTLDILDRQHNRRRFMKRPSPHQAGQFNYYKQYQYYNYQHIQPYSNSVPSSPATVYVDRLFEESSSKLKENNVGVTMEASTLKLKESNVTMEASTSGGAGSSGCCDSGGGGGKKRKNVVNKWREYISSMPAIKGVDERAEEFISKFRQQMSLQREQSIIDFHEMLARSV